ncbi:hypothetical protein BCF59_0003 [Mycoplasmopsis mustelae]|uniref:Lipoprotein n=1 Tax=Mycoplasmopsis mustelae TaxID=171289 RepID=A0A4R7UCH1_9BACT|nr:hypothetical protein [Mycoplasmopsis mustelae]TDV24059.1 hypothetical protein BCF59_0003 [Mycoplasmopsis mustelae]
MKLTFLKNIVCIPVLSTPFIVMSCASNETDYDDNYRDRFTEYLKLYQKDNKVKRTKSNYFLNLWTENYYEKIKIFEKGYEIFYTPDDVRNKFLNKFNLKMLTYWKNKAKDPYIKININDIFGFDIENINEKEFKTKNEEKFEEEYLNGMKINEFFINNNLILSTSWHSRYNINYDALPYLIPDIKNTPNSAELSYIKLKPNQLKMHKYVKTSSGGQSFIDSVIISKKYKINPIINDNLPRSEVIKIFKFLDKKYEVK